MGVWTKVKTVVARLKLPPGKGAIGLWVGPGTDGYFANLRVTAQQ